MKVTIEFELSIDNLEKTTDEEKFEAIEQLLHNGAESVRADVTIKEISFKG